MDGRHWVMEGGLALGLAKPLAILPDIRRVVAINGCRICLNPEAKNSTSGLRHGGRMSTLNWWRRTHAVVFLVSATISVAPAQTFTTLFNFEGLTAQTRSRCP